jgi:hypothetical protein
MKTLSAKIELFTDLGEKQADYKGYSPVNCDFTIKKRKTFNSEDIVFPECIEGRNTIDFVKVTFSNGIEYKSRLNNDVIIAPLMRPLFNTGTLIIKKYV